MPDRSGGIIDAAVNPSASSTQRRYDLDWIRVGAFCLLILYHVGLVYGVYDWHIHSAHTFAWMREAILITNPWRLTLLFLVSGAALRFMTLRRTPRQVARARFERLVPPLLFGAVVLVPIQSWIEAMDKGGWPNGVAGYLAWMGREFSLGGLADGVPVNHLWFIVYIAAYSVVTILLWRRPGLIDRLGDWLQKNLAGPRLLVLPILYLIAIRIGLFPWFGVTNVLHWDWYNHALSLAAFVFGFSIVGRESLWRDMERYRWLALGLAAAALPAWLEALFLVAVTFLGSLAVYEVVRRIPAIRPLWGLKPLDGRPWPLDLKALLRPTQRYHRRRRLLGVGVAAPLLALTVVAAAIAAYPGFDNATQYLSELGGASASAPIIFNGGVFAAGIMAGLGGIGFGLAVYALTGARVAGWVIVVVFVLAGTGMAGSTLYPWPDPRHMVINLALGIQLAPLLLLWGLHRRRDMPRLKVFLAATFVVMAVLTVLTKHLVLPGAVNDANVGWWERLYALVLVGWVGVAAWVLDRKLLAHATESPPPRPASAVLDVPA